MTLGRQPQPAAQRKSMRLLEAVPVERVVAAFRNDQKVQRLGNPWPDTLHEQIAHLRKAHRPVDDILSLAWGLYALDHQELLSTVRPVWCPHAQPDYCWTLEEMFAAVRAGTFKPPEPNNVPALEADMKLQFRDDDFLLIGYRDIPKGIRFEDGHNRATAAFLAGVLPATVKMFIGGPVPSCRSGQ
jgi:hypothetical protein